MTSDVLMMVKDSQEVPGGHDLVWYKPSEGECPVFRIGADGELTVHKMGATPSEMAHLFWESVQFQGISYSQKVRGLEQAVATLYNDPFKDVVMDGEYEIFKALKDQKAGVSMASVRRVLEAIKQICKMETN